jgi:hypothetical protein
MPRRASYALTCWTPGPRSTPEHPKIDTAEGASSRTEPCVQQRDQSSGFTAELERQAWDDEGREEDRQKALPSASEGDGLALGGLKGSSSAGVSATANLQGVTARFYWYLDCVVHVDRTGTLTINHDVVRAPSNLDSD